MPGAATRRTSLALATRLTVLILGPCFALATDGLEPIGVGMRANARGGADVAVGDSALSQIDNPASLARWRYPRIDTEAQLAIVAAPLRTPFDTAYSQRQLIPLANLGYAQPLDPRWTLGLALHSKAGLGTDYPVRHLMIPFMDRRIGTDVKVFDTQLNVGYRLTDQLFVGAGARIEVATARFSTVLGPADLDFGRGYAYGGGFQTGLLYRPRPDLSLGLAYRSPTWYGDLAGGDVRAALFGIVPVTLGRGAIPDLRLPQRISAGLAWDATDWLKLVGELRWINYGGTSFHATSLVLDGPLPLRYPFPLGYRDQWAAILGAEVRLSEHWVLGAGYHYATAPVDRLHMLPICSAISQHHATLGVRYERDNWWVGVGYVLGFPTTLRGCGRSAIPLSIDSAHSEITQTQHIIAIGFGFSW